VTVHYAADEVDLINKAAKASSETRASWLRRKTVRAAKIALGLSVTPDGD
jgi:hypothetical protein